MDVSAPVIIPVRILRMNSEIPVFITLVTMAISRAGQRRLEVTT